MRPKRFLLLGDGVDAVGDPFRQKKRCTPPLDPRHEGAVHVLLRRALCEIHGLTRFDWVHPIPIAAQMGGAASDHASWAKRLRGEPSSRRLQGKPYLSEYLATQGHGIDVAIFVHDTESDGRADAIIDAVTQAAGAWAGVAHVEVGAMVPCLEAWLLGRASAPGPCEPLKDELRQAGVTDRRSKRERAEQVDIRALHRNVPELADLVDRVAVRVGAKKDGEPG